MISFFFSFKWIRAELKIQLSLVVVIFPILLIRFGFFFVFQDTRSHIVVELYDTERSYVESLQILVTVSTKVLLINTSVKNRVFLVFPVPEVEV